MTNEVSLNQHREDATHFCRTALSPLCEELIAWTETGVLGEAPFFRTLTLMCEKYANGYGRQVANDLVKYEAVCKVAKGE